MLNNKEIEEIREQKNIAIIVVSSNFQDVSRQRAEFQRIEQLLDIQFEYVELKNRKRTNLDRAALDILTIKTKMYGDINQWRHDCSRYGTADTWELTKIAIKDKYRSGELYGRVRCFILSPLPYEITNPVMDMQTKMLFQISTEEMKNLTKRILGIKRAQCLNGQHSGGDIPFPCDVVRFINGVETLHIHQLRSSMSRIRNKAMSPKYELTSPEFGIRLCYGTKEDTLPPLRFEEKQFYILTKDIKRVELIKEVHQWCLEQTDPIVWHKLAKFVNDKYYDTWGTGWTSERIKNLMLNTAIIGKPSIGKTAHTDNPSLIIRSKSAPDGYAHNEKELSGKMPEDTWVIPDRSFFNLISEDDFFKLKDKIFKWDTIRKNNLMNEDLKKRQQGLISTENQNKYLRGLVWDVIDDCSMRISRDRISCPVRDNHRKGSHDRGCGARLAIASFDRVINDYISLPEWDCILDEYKKSDGDKYSKDNTNDKVIEYLHEEKLALELRQEYKIVFKDKSEDERKQIDTLSKIIYDLEQVIRTCQDYDELLLLNNCLKERENERTAIKLQIDSAVKLDHYGCEAQLVDLYKTIQKFCCDGIDKLKLRELFILHDIKILINKAKMDEEYIKILSLTNSNIPCLKVSYYEWKKKYVSVSLRARPQLYQKGHPFFPKKNLAVRDRELDA